MMYSQDGFFDDFHELAPEPIRVLPSWKGVLAGIFQRDPDLRWGAQLMRISSDMMVVCDEDLDILHHNRAFLKGVGYTAGTFTGENLSVFFPSAEREDAIEAFDGLKRGHAAGMRVRPVFLTAKGHRKFDLRVVRSRNGDGSYTYFMVARDTSKDGGPIPRNEAKSPGHASGSGRNEPPWNARGGKEHCETKTRKVFLEPIVTPGDDALPAGATRTPRSGCVDGEKSGSETVALAN